MFASRSNFKPRAALLIAASLFAGCGEGADGMGGDVDLPGVPDLMPGMAMVSGRVVDRMGAGVAASLLVAETDATATAGSDGTFMMTVPGDSTITLKVTAAGFAPTFVESLQVPIGKSSTGFEILVVPEAKIEEYAQLAQAGVMDRGLVAVMMKSVGGSCPTMGGARVVFDHPTLLGKVIYAKQGVPMAGDPDPALNAVQVTTGVSAWLAAAVPPGNTYDLSIEKAGCTAKTGPVTFADRIHTGRFRIAAKALTQITLFTE